MALPEDYSLSHDQLGEVIGRARGPDIVQFRGIPFAAIPARFRQSIVRETLPVQPFDAREPGPFCPQPLLPYPSYWDGPPLPDLPVLTPPGQDELGCLNLCITTSRARLEQVGNGKVPILLFIHGGAFVGGSQSIHLGGREVYDGSNLARASMARGQEVVVVTINYRVGPLGFLASRELEAYNRSHGEPVGNYGLHDQRQALEWCNRFIAGFGGDPDNITIQGTSAGGSSAHYLTLFPERKFRRAILSSGTMIGIGPRPMQQHQQKFQAYVDKHVGPRSDSASDVVSALQAVPVQEFVKPVLPDIFNPLIDGTWIPGGTMESIRHLPDPPELMIGACAYEKELTELVLTDPAMAKSQPDDGMLAAAANLMSANGMLKSPADVPFSHSAVIEAYGLQDALDAPSRAVDGWSSLMADLAFRLAPLYVAALHPGGGALVYEIQATNPFPSWATSYGKANHGINDLLLFNVAEDQVGPAELEHWRSSVAQVQGAWLDFSYGKQPWEPVRRGTYQLGPICKMDGKGPLKTCDTVEELVGDVDARRWKSLLDISRGF
ncbi:Alpha/Beta hydrolase protein [Xylariaceae sp. FL0804]|nr:Alpha/Beta hydrolase protein [Xylariaceae sp. FL0804]